MTENIKPKQTRAILIGTYSENISKEKAKEYLNELNFLAITAKIEVVKVFYNNYEALTRNILLAPANWKQ